MSIARLAAELVAIVAVIFIVIGVIGFAGDYVTRKTYDKEINEYLANNPTVYLDGEVVDPYTLIWREYKYEYDPELNVLKFTKIIRRGTGVIHVPVVP